MPNVTIDNPAVQVDLSSGESFTVPGDQRLSVTVIGDPFEGAVELNGKKILDGRSGNYPIVKVDLFGGDTINASNPARIRGYRVD